MSTDGQIAFLIDVIKEHNKLFEKLDKALASPSRVRDDTAVVGSFVSSLDLTETAQEIVQRAINKLKE